MPLPKYPCWRGIPGSLKQYRYNSLSTDEEQIEKCSNTACGHPVRYQASSMLWRWGRGRCRTRCPCWTCRRCWRSSKIYREVIKGFEVYYRSSCNIVALDYITRLHKGKLRRKGEVGGEDGILPFNLDVIDGVVTLLHR